MTAKPRPTYSPDLFALEQEQKARVSTARRPFAPICIVEGCGLYGSLSEDFGRTYRCEVHNGLLQARRDAA